MLFNYTETELLEALKAKCFEAMIDKCFELIGKRINTLRKLKLMIKDRR